MSRRRWLVLTLVFLGILVSYVDRGNLSIAAESIMRELRLPPATMGVLLSAFFWTYAVCQIPAGWLVDRFGVRGVYASAFVVWSLASASIALSHGPADVIASRMVLGFAETVGPVASLAVIRASFSPRENGLPTAIYISGQTLGPATGLLLGTTLLVHFGWRAMFAVTGLAALLWAPGWWAVAPPVERKAVSARFDWSEILRDSTLWAMAAFIFFASYYWYFLLTWVPSYLTSARGFSTMAMGRILSAPLAAMAITNIVAGFYADRLLKKAKPLFRIRLWFVAGGSLGASTLVLLNLLPDNKLVMPVLLVSVCSFGVVSSNFWTGAQNVAPPQKVGRVIGFLNTISQIGGVTAPIITGQILGPAKHFAPAVAIAGICPLISLVPLFLASRGIDLLRGRLHGEHEFRRAQTAGSLDTRNV
jgi:ACS family D-galactonate transporter-like MFS transporter